MVSVQFAESVRRHIPTRNRLEVGRLSECTKLSLLRCNDAKGSAPKWLAIGEPFCSSEQFRRIQLKDAVGRLILEPVPPRDNT
jgi:hypothetical protein